MWAVGHQVYTEDGLYDTSIDVILRKARPRELSIEDGGSYQNGQDLLPCQCRRVNCGSGFTIDGRG